MANWWQVQRLKRGVKGWNIWRKKHPNVEPDLSEANLSGADLHEANLSGANLHKANLFYNDLGLADLSHTWMHRAILHSAKLMQANLSGANLREADLRNANLYYANLSGADLSEADLSRANLSRANLSGAFCSQTVFLHINFRTTKGLARINHLGPSPIHLSSLQLPQDDSALHFLRGVGLTDEQIDAWRSTAMLPIQYHSVFISYSSKDETLAHRLHVDLQAHGVRCWFAPEDMKIGNKIRDRIDQAIHLQDRSLLLLSEHSIASTWVENEVEAILEKEDHQKREILFPVRVDEVVMHTSKAWAATLRRTRHIGDFTAWTEPEKYQIAFERLLRDMKHDGSS